MPGWESSIRMTSLMVVPRRPDQIPRIKYSVPMSLWLVEKNQRKGLRNKVLVLRV